jgi:hypothetical protein
MPITAKIKEMKYTSLLGRDLNTYDFHNLNSALNTDATFILRIDDKNSFAVSWWRSAKRTRSYPYSRVYDSLAFAGKKITIIPIFKDEGKDGDRDFLQWDTISMMSLLDVHVIISYYNDASQSSRYEKKVTNQIFDVDYIKSQIKELLSYKSSALHWNVSQADKVWVIGKKALESYGIISKKLGVEMHSQKSAEKRIAELKEGKEHFMKFSRVLAELAQKRESITIQPKENLDGKKEIITITNYLGGNYYLTVDEIELHDQEVYLIDAKHTKDGNLPSLLDIKDALLKMILFTNLENVQIDGKNYTPVPVVKLTVGGSFDIVKLNENQRKTLELLKKESKLNAFRIVINKIFVE